MPDQDDMPVLATIADMTAASLERCDLPPDVLLLVRLAALVAVDATPMSYLAHVGAGIEVGVTLDDMQNVLIAIAPIVGTARVTSGALQIADALGIAALALEDDDE